jgi:hypothetical protein
MFISLSVLAVIAAANLRAVFAQKLEDELLGFWILFEIPVR